MSAATLVIGDRQITAYAVSGNTDNFYYLYGIDENGTEQWYQYDADDGVCSVQTQRFLQRMKGDERGCGIGFRRGQ